MKLKNARTCESCRFYMEEAGGVCEADFNNRGEYNQAFGMHKREPQEPCPKPVTIKEYFAVREEMMNNHVTNRASKR